MERKKNNFIYDLNKFKKNDNIYIYGTGETAANLYLYLRTKRKDITVECFIDSYKSGKFNNKKVLKFDDSRDVLNKKSKIIIASIFWSEIEKLLIKYKVANYKILSNSLFHEISNLSKLEEFYFTSNEIVKYKKKISKIIRLFHDKKDREKFKVLFNLRNKNYKNRNLLEYKISKYREKTLPYLDAINKTNIKIILEGGVYDGGDTIRFNKECKNVKKIYGFEPFEFFIKQNKYADSIFSNSKIEIIPKAIWNSKCKLILFGNIEGSNSVLINDNNHKTNVNMVDAISIDEFVRSRRIKKIDYIKLDIEGAEMEALRGALNTLKWSRPQVAISIYHIKNHLIDIPEFLTNILDDYRFELHNYTSTFIDTILYAVPNELAIY